jgi:integrase
MSVPKKNEDGTWRVDFYPSPGAKRERKTPFTRKKDAEEYINSRKADYKNKTALIQKRFSTLTFEQIAVQYRDSHLAKGKASGNVSYMNNLIREFGDHILSKISTSEVRIYFEKFFDGEIVSQKGHKYEISTIEKHLTYFKRVFNYAIEREIIAINPIKEIRFTKQFKKKNKRNKSLSQEDFNKFNDLFKDQRWWAKGVITVLWHTGMRIGEVRNLKWCEVDLKAGVITLDADRVKEGKTRTIGVEKEALDLLVSLKEINNRKGAKNKDHVFGVTLENALSYNTVYDMFRDVVKRTEFSEFNIHDIRHSYAIRKRREGWDKEVIKAQMGHVTDSMWNWYNDVAAEEVAEMSGYNQDQQEIIRSDVEGMIEKMRENGISMNTFHTVLREKAKDL